MILATSYKSEEIFQHFDRSKESRLYEVEDGRILRNRVMLVEENGHSALADMPGELGAIVLMRGGVGDEAKQTPAQWGIRVLAGVQGPMEQVMEEYLVRQPSASAGATCDHRYEERHSYHDEDSYCH